MGLLKAMASTIRLTTMTSADDTIASTDSSPQDELDELPCSTPVDTACEESACSWSDWKDTAAVTSEQESLVMETTVPSALQVSTSKS